MLEIRRAGLCTTIQDLGRPGLGRLGVGPSGAMDAWAHRVANQLLGNDRQRRRPGVDRRRRRAEFLQDTRFALAGGDLGAALDGTPVPALCVFPVAAGAQLHFVERRQGARATLAVAGGLRVAPALGSAATDLGAGIGGDRLAVRCGPASSCRRLPSRRPAPLAPELATLQRLRALLPLPAAARHR